MLEKYDYNLPKHLIAVRPASPRDGANLLIYNKKDGRIYYDKFYNLDKYLPKGAVLVFNQTKVIPARMFLNKETGGRVEILYLKRKDNLIEVLTDRKLNIGSFLYLKSKKVFSVFNQDNNIYFLKPFFPLNQLESFFVKYGTMPIPPYIKNTSLSEKDLRNKYQSIFARESGSVAAPTASLHFTNRLLNKLEKSGFSLQFITLHVGLGTFSPLKEEDFNRGELHGEEYLISEKTALFLNEAKREGKPIVAVGTTVTRSLESAAIGSNLKKLSSKTKLFVREGYEFKFVDGMITNFHLPKSSLLVLVSAFMGRENVIECYNNAIQKKFKFFSFGDGMLIL